MIKCLNQRYPRGKKKYHERRKKLSETTKRVSNCFVISNILYDKEFWAISALMKRMRLTLLQQYLLHMSPKSHLRQWINGKELRDRDYGYMRRRFTRTRHVKIVKIGKSCTCETDPQSNSSQKESARVERTSYQWKMKRMKVDRSKTWSSISGKLEKQSPHIGVGDSGSGVYLCIFGFGFHFLIHGQK